MDNLVLQQKKRGSFSSPGRKDQENTETKEDHSAVNRWDSSRQMSEDHEARDSQFATAVAAAAFAIHSLEQTERAKKEALRDSRAKAKSRRVEIASETMPSSSRITRLFSTKEASTKREATRKSSIGRQEKDAAPKQPSRPLFLRPKIPEERLQMRGGFESKADVWERDHMRKVLERYEKTKSAILDWENQKKLQAKLKMEDKKSLLELRRTRNMQHYQNKIARIEKIAGGARSQLDDKRKKDELAVKDKAKSIRSRGNVGVKCFCFTC